MSGTEGSTKAEESTEARESEASCLKGLTGQCSQRSARLKGKCNNESGSQTMHSRVIPSASLESDYSSGAGGSSKAPEGQSFSGLRT